MIDTSLNTGARSMYQIAIEHLVQYVVMHTMISHQINEIVTQNTQVSRRHFVEQKVCNCENEKEQGTRLDLFAENIFKESRIPKSKQTYKFKSIFSLAYLNSITEHLVFDDLYKQSHLLSCIMG